MKTACLIYIHGIGSRHREEEIGTLLDGLDKASQSPDNSALGKARKYSYDVENIESTDDEIKYITFHRIDKFGGAPVTTKKIKIYECYWSHKAINRFGIWSVLWWFLKNFTSTAPLYWSSWRDFSNFRLTALHSIATSETKYEIQTIEKLYLDFDTWDNRKRYPKGTLAEFKRFVGEQSSEKLAVRLNNTIELWRKSSKKNAVFGSITAISFFLSLTILTAGFSYLIGYVAFLSYNVVLNSHAISWSDTFILINFAAYILFAFCTARYFQTHIADVMFWTTTNEKDEKFSVKRDIKLYIERFIQHVLSTNPGANVVVLGHSLGSEIAFEAICSMGAKLRTLERQKKPLQQLGELNRIKALIVYGSPIDRIANFFQRNTNSSRRFGRIALERKRSAKFPPFNDSPGRKGAMIFNFWSRIDPISSPVYSTAYKAADVGSRIQNFEIDVGDALSPASAHGSYYDNAPFMDFVYAAIMGKNLITPKVAQVGPIDTKIRYLYALCAAFFLLLPMSYVCHYLLNDTRPSQIVLLCIIASCLMIAITSEVRRRKLLAKGLLR